MAKSRASVYFCQNCGYESSKWMGQCPGCREWNTFVEEKAPELPGGSHAGADPKARPVKLGDIEIREEDRISTGMDMIPMIPDKDFNYNPAKTGFKPDMADVPEPLRKAFERHEAQHREKPPTSQAAPKADS